MSRPQKDTGLNAYNRDATYVRFVQNYCSNAATRQVLRNTSVPMLEHIPQSFFLPEYGLVGIPQDEGYCGSCYAFSSRNVLHSLLMRDLPYYEQIGIGKDFEGVRLGSDSISVQYLLNLAGITNYYCDGGNFIDVVSHVVSTRMKTLELTSHFPYISFLTQPGDVFEDFEQYFPVILPNQYLLPVHWFERDTNDCPISVFQIVADDWAVGWTEEEREEIKHIIARGFAVETEVSTEGGGDKSESRFQRYSSGILRGTCTMNRANHEVTIVGYGTYKGTPVWAMANSWGSAFGLSGFYFVEEGSNAYCHESQAHAIFSRFWGYEDDLPFIQSAIYLQNKHQFPNVLKGRMKRGFTGLDNEDGSFYVTREWQWALLLTIISVPCAFLLYIAVTELFFEREFMKINKPPIIIATTAEQEADVDWTEDCVSGILEDKQYSKAHIDQEIMLAFPAEDQLLSKSALLEDE